MHPWCNAEVPDQSSAALDDPHQIQTDEKQEADDTDEELNEIKPVLGEYEAQRRKRILENQSFLASLGLDAPSTILSTDATPNQPAKRGRCKRRASKHARPSQSVDRENKSHEARTASAEEYLSLAVRVSGRLAVAGHPNPSSASVTMWRCKV